MEGYKSLINSDIRDRVLYKASFCREFEKTVQDKVNAGEITCPVYLSLGQELLPAILSEVYPESFIFAQHRAHSTYLCYSRDPLTLAKTLISSREGSASIQIPNKMLGHSGFMGDQIPIAVGFCMRSGKHTLAIMGDASGEEDYVLGAMAFASSRNLPMLFIVEDNNLSILTEKNVRRDWELDSVAKYFGMLDSTNVNDELETLLKTLTDLKKSSKPALINVNSTRLCWHSGSGNNEGLYDRLSDEIAGKEHLVDLAVRDNKKVWQSI